MSVFSSFACSYSFLIPALLNPYVIILDLKEKWTVDSKKLISKGKNCAHLYYGDKIKGNVKTTIVNGRVVFDKNNFYKYPDLNYFVTPIN